jgi:ribosome biogenesis GTPase
MPGPPPTTDDAIEASTPPVDLTIYGWDAGWEAAFRPFAAEGLTPARVAIEYNHLLRLYTTNGDVRAQHSGKLLHSAAGRHAMAAVGDWVAIRRNPGERTAVISMWYSS